MNKKKDQRLRRARRGRMHIRELEIPRLTVYRSPRHIYAQIISASGDTVKAAASSRLPARCISSQRVTAVLGVLHAAVTKISAFTWVESRHKVAVKRKTTVANFR